MVNLNNIVKVLLVLAIFLLVRFDQAWTFYPATDFIDQMDIQVENDLLSQAPYHLFWFGQKDRTLKLHYNVLLGNQPFSLYALTKQEAIVMVPPQQSRTAYRLDKDYSGTFAAVIPPIQVDLNNDGKSEKLQLSAKVDTLFAQPHIPIRTVFGESWIPFEVCFKGNQAILLLFNNKPLCYQTVRLVSRRGYGCGSDRTVTTDGAGMLQVADVRDLRTGISISYQDGDQTHYIASYRLEANSIFTKRYQRALLPLVKVLLWAVGLIGLIIIGRRVCLEFDRDVLAQVINEWLRRLAGKRLRSIKS
ncbi:MAG: hypothetical protein PVH64_09175 [Bacillota bacterium]